MPRQSIPRGRPPFHPENFTSSQQGPCSTLARPSPVAIKPFILCSPSDCLLLSHLALRRSRDSISEWNAPVIPCFPHHETLNQNTSVMDVTVAPEIIITQYLIIYRRMLPIPHKFRVYSRFPWMHKTPACLRAQDPIHEGPNKETM